MTTLCNCSAGGYRGTCNRQECDTSCRCYDTPDQPSPTADDWRVIDSLLANAKGLTAAVVATDIKAGVPDDTVTHAEMAAALKPVLERITSYVNGYPVFPIVPPDPGGY